MKRFIGLLSLVFVLISNLFAYDYQTVYSHRTALFAASSGEVKTMKIDSVKFNGDSILYPLKNIQQLGTNCFTPYGASWLGSKIIVKPGWNYFFNRDNDTIKIKTDAKLHERWLFYANSEIEYYASVLKIEQVNFLGITDTIKTIDFDLMILMPHLVKSKISKDFDGQTIQISKNFGLIKTFNMLVFPYQNETSKSIINWDQFIIAGLTNPTMGVQNLTWFDVFDFQAGDEIHSKFTSYETQAGPPTYYRTYTVIKYISRINYSDSIVYQTERTEKDSAFTGTINTDATYFNGIEKKIIKKDKFFDLLPGESYINNQNAIATNVMTDSTIIFKSNPVEINYNKKLNCWSTIPEYYEDGYSTRYSKYLKGLGGPYFKFESFGLYLSSSIAENKLVYYKKGSSTWGVPLVISGINQPKAESNITILPNPATDKITISNLTEPSTVELLDLKGSVMQRTTITTSENTLNLSQYDKGLYLYCISANGVLLKAGKIVKN